jgi:hypothetical protein
VGSRLLLALELAGWLALGRARVSSLSRLACVSTSARAHGTGLGVRVAAVGGGWIGSAAGAVGPDVFPLVVVDRGPQELGLVREAIANRSPPWPSAAVSRAPFPLFASQKLKRVFR